MRRYIRPYPLGESDRQGLTLWSIRRLTDREDQTIDAAIVTEEPLDIRLNGRTVAVLMRTPGLERELAAGFCLGEGLVADLAHIGLIQHCGRTAPPGSAESDEIDRSRNRVDVTLLPGTSPAEAGRDAALLIRSGCGRADISAMTADLHPIDKDNLRVPFALLPSLLGRITEQQAAYRAAGGIHAAAVFDRHGRLVTVCEDVGRHNAVDKAAGYCLLRGIALHDKVLISTGRASYDMVAKGVRLRVPLLISTSSPTSLAVELAQSLNCTLAGYLRGKALNIYTHGWRITTNERKPSCKNSDLQG